jgi:P-type Cu2+ transporter
MTRQTTVLHVGGLHWATSEPVFEKVLLRRPGVLDVQANAVAETATVTYDPDRTSVAELADWVRDCGYHCAENVSTLRSPRMSAAAIT